jgi:glutamine synthetase
MPNEKLMFAALGDVAGQVRGKGFPVADRAARFLSGIGWTPTNVQITCFDSIANSPYGALGDLILRPAPETEVQVALGGDAPDVHFVLCDVAYADGRDWECCLRSMARSAAADLESKTRLRLHSAFEHEFVVKSMAEADQSYSLRGFQKGKALGETLISALRQAGLAPDSFLREYGERQYEVTVKPASGVAAADQALILRELARAAGAFCREEISFTPIIAPGSVGSGVHVHMSLRYVDGTPATYDALGAGQLSALAGAFVAGILKYVDAFVAISAPSVISYTRLTPHRWSAAFNNLGYRDREAAVRICPVTATDEAGKAQQFHFEFRAADAAANPHLLLAVLIRAGLKGIEEGLTPPPATEEDLSLVDAGALARRGIARLPATLADALKKLDESGEVRGWLPPGFVDIYLAHKRGEMAFLNGKPENEVFAAYANAY